MGRLTAYAGYVENLEKVAFQDFIDAVEQGILGLNIDRSARILFASISGTGNSAPEIPGEENGGIQHFAFTNIC